VGGECFSELSWSELLVPCWLGLGTWDCCITELAGSFFARDFVDHLALNLCRSLSLSHTKSNSSRSELAYKCLYYFWFSNFLGFLLSSIPENTVRNYELVLVQL
jgi:hypothetical protein